MVELCPITISRKVRNRTTEIFNLIRNIPFTTNNGQENISRCVSGFILPSMSDSISLRYFVLRHISEIVHRFIVVIFMVSLGHLFRLRFPLNFWFFNLFLNTRIVLFFNFQSRPFTWFFVFAVASSSLPFVFWPRNTTQTRFIWNLFYLLHL